MLTFFRKLLGVNEHNCAACIARDYHIASLKEQLRYFQQRLDERIVSVSPAPPVERMEQHSIPRANSLAARIRRAEQFESKPELTEQRKKEFTERINALLQPEIKPEIEVKDDAVG